MLDLPWSFSAMALPEHRECTQMRSGALVSILVHTGKSVIISAMLDDMANFAGQCFDRTMCLFYGGEVDSFSHAAILLWCSPCQMSTMLVKAHGTNLDLDGACGAMPCTISLHFSWKCVFSNTKEEEEIYECQICC
eukprot:5257910-Ditylum_brightwellii.AAC.1